MATSKRPDRNSATKLPTVSEVVVLGALLQVLLVQQPSVPEERHGIRQEPLNPINPKPDKP